MVLVRGHAGLVMNKLSQGVFMVLVRHNFDRHEAYDIVAYAIFRAFQAMIVPFILLVFTCPVRNAPPSCSEHHGGRTDLERQFIEYTTSLTMY